MAGRVGVSSSTIRNRIDRLEADGIISGYHPEVDHEAADLPLQVSFVISAPSDELEAYSRELRGIQGIIDVREMLTGRRNIHVDVVGTSTTDVTRTTDAVDDLGVDIESSETMRTRHVQPFTHFFFQGTGPMSTRGEHDEDDSPD